MLQLQITPHNRNQNSRRAPMITVEQIQPGVWRAAYWDRAGTVRMTEEAPTADLAFRRLRDRSIAAGHEWTIYATDEP
jgi:hypothetical protein